MADISSLSLTLFFLCFPLAGLWLLMCWYFSKQMSKRHPSRYFSMGLDKLFPRSASDWKQRGVGEFHFDNSAPTMALLSFVWNRKDKVLSDRRITGITVFMRRLLITYLLVFGGAFISFSYEIATFTPDTRQTTSEQASGYQLYNQDRHQEAISEFDRLLREDFNNAEALYWRAMSHWHVGDRDAAVRDFNQVTYIDRKNYKAHLHIDEILQSDRRFLEIIASWDRFIRYNPNHAEALYQRAGTHYHNGDMTKSRSDLTRACRLGHQAACSREKRLP